MLKRCLICEVEKDRSEFHRATAAKDGLFAYCKPCARTKANRWRQEHPAEHAAAAREFHHRHKAEPEYRAMRARNSVAWKRANPEKVQAAFRRWCAEHPEHVRTTLDRLAMATKTPERRRAHDRVAKAIRAGVLTRPGECEACGIAGTRIEAAHYDYRPENVLKVRWLCRSCHVKWDRWDSL